MPDLIERRLETLPPMSIRQAWLAIQNRCVALGDSGAPKYRDGDLLDLENIPGTRFGPRLLWSKARLEEYAREREGDTAFKKKVGRHA